MGKFGQRRNLAGLKELPSGTGRQGWRQRQQWRDIASRYIFYFMAVLGLRCCAQAFSSCSEWGYSRAEVRGHLIAVVSPVADSRHTGFSTCRSRTLGHRLSSCEGLNGCSMVCGIFPDQGSNMCLLRWQVYSLSLTQQGNSHF